MFPWTGVEEDGFGVIQAHCTQVHHLLCSLVPNRHGLLPIHGPGVEDTYPRGQGPRAHIRPGYRWEHAKVRNRNVELENPL